VSTRITSALAACDGHDLVCAQTLSGMPSEPGEPVRLGLLLNLNQYDPAIRTTLKIDHASRSDSEKLADLL
jgi:hypothetical protein